MKYALVVTSAEAHPADSREEHDTPMTKAGDRFWVTLESEGWVEATSVRFKSYRDVPRDLKVFNTIGSATRFAARWKGHPWWCKPTGAEVVSVEAKTRIVPDGWRVPAASR